MSQSSRSETPSNVSTQPPSPSSSDNNIGNNNNDNMGNAPTPNITNKNDVTSAKSEQQQQEADKKSFKANVELASIILLNICSVVGIVAVNKKIFMYPEFKFPSTLMSLHFVVTYLFVLLLKKVGYFEEKVIETKQYAKLGAAQVGSVAMVNLSLVYNDVGTYQLMKFLVIFVTCVLEYFFYKKVYSCQIYSILSGVVISISLATITSLNPSTVGVSFGLLGALGTAYYQIYNKFVQTEFDVKALQLLHYEQPWSAAWCMLFALVSEPVYMIPYVQWTQELVGLIALSAICAFCVNASVYMILGKTGPITYSVLGHVKTISVFAIGIFFLGDSFSKTQAFWMFMAFLMIVLYGHFSQQPGASSTPPAPKTSTEDSNELQQQQEKERLVVEIKSADDENRK